MKLMRSGLLVTVMLFAATFAYSQAKVGILNTEAFSDEKTGITRLVNAYKSLEAEFKPKQDELNTLAARLDKLAKEIQDLQAKVNNPNPAVPIKKDAVFDEIANKNEEGSRLQLEIKRKQEDAKAQFEKRTAVVANPIKNDIGNAIDVFTKARGIDIMLDVSKLAESGILLSINKAVDLTDAFIKDYNAKTAGVPLKK